MRLRYQLHRRVLFIALACFVSASATRTATAQGLPARLTDQEFFRLITDVSEPNGFFDSDNLLSNEPSAQRAIPMLQANTQPGGVYLGVGPEQNFTYIAAMQPAMAVIFDIRRGNLQLHLLYKALFELSTNRADFLARMYSRPRPAGLDTLSTVAALFAAYDGVRPDSALYRLNVAEVRAHLLNDHGFALDREDLAGIEYVYEAFYRAGPDLDYNYPNTPRRVDGRPTYATLMQLNDGQGVQRSYLANETNFRAIRTMEVNNMIVPVVGDFGGTKTIVAVGRYVADHGATVSAFYTSNVEQYLFDGPAWRRFYTNMATLPLGPTSVVIRAVFASGRVIPGLAQAESVTLVGSMRRLVEEFGAGRVGSYAAVVGLSN